MCGIAGIISTDPSLVSADRIKKMTDTLTHRGVDGEGQWMNDAGTVAFGHRRLSIIDLSDAGKQPMEILSLSSKQTGPRYSIIHNGEIYNYIELKEELTKKGYSFFSKTDTEVIGAAYDCWGEDCVAYFDGMFAFAIWDKEEKVFFAAKDRFGEKPFFFWHNKNEFVFASEMKALWAIGIPRTPNLKLLFNYLTIGYADNPNIPEETFFENISKLPAACFLKLKFDRFQLAIENYWDIEPENADEKITDADAVEKFNSLFHQSVKRRLRSDVSIGTSLSGGLDSSSIISTVRSLTSYQSPFAAFTSVFPGFEKDESPFAKQIADKFDLQHFTVSPGAETLLADFDKLFYHQEEPFSSSSIYAQFKVYELAKQKGIKVLLDGQGADETLAGYHKYYKWYWQELFRQRSLMKSGELEAAKENHVQESFGWKNIIASLFPELASVVLERKYLLNALQQEDLTAEFTRYQSKEAYYTTPDYHNLNGVLYFNTIQHGLEELLRYADRNSMAHGREVRLPFLNHELVEFLFTLPSRFKIRKGWTKWLLREAMKNHLPAEIVWRRDKTGFEPPQLKWMQNSNIQELIMDAKKNLVEKKILKPGVLDNKIKPAAAHEAANYDWRYLCSAYLFK